MAAKRSATSDLNHDNWDDDECPEEAGTFTKAPDEVLEKRVVKTVRRRLTGSGNVGTTAKSAFGSFAGFKTGTFTTTTATSTANSSPFSFLANINSTNTTTSSASINAAPKTSTATNTNGATKSPVKSVSQTSSTVTKSPEKNKSNNVKGDQQSNEYYAKLKGLNESVTQWIKTHVDANPFCILTPIFKDYEKYFNEIETKYGVNAKATAETKSSDETNKNSETKTTEPLSNTESKIPESTSSIFSNLNTKKTEWKTEKSIFGNTTGTTSVTATSKSIFGNTSEQKPLFGTSKPHDLASPTSIFGSGEQKSEVKSVFGEKNPFLSKPEEKSEEKEEGSQKSEEKSAPTTLPASTGTFSFGQSTTSSTLASAGFSFGGSKPFSFGSHMVKPSGLDSQDKGEADDKEEDNEPPKPEFKPITEPGAVYEQKCKVFVKKEQSFSDRGVGYLFLKPTSTGKTQLIVRAENTLGNLLLNTLLNESIPTKRMNKNTVMIVCVPLPNNDSQPVPVLLRVKTSEDADTLLETLNKHKK